MFEPDAASSPAFAAVNVLLISQYYIDDTPDAKLVAQFRYLQDHSIKIALALQGIAANPRCRGANEGFGPPEDSARMIAKLQRLGLRLDYVRLDEPVWFGHFYADPGACQYSSPDLARQVLAIVRLYLDAFPAIEVGEVEPVPVMTVHHDWARFQSEWMQEFTRVSGRPIAFLHTEVHTQIPAWRNNLQKVAQVARDHHTPFGVIYNSSGPDRDDAAWVRHAIALFEETESDLAIMPDQAVFQTWEPRPSRIFPETSDSTLSHVVQRYLLPRTKLAAVTTEDGLRGQVRITGSRHHPINDASVTINALGADPSEPLPVLTLTGKVPGGARSALVGVRLNMECNCQGEGDFVLGAMTYKDDGGRNFSARLPTQTPSGGKERSATPDTPRIMRQRWTGEDVSRVIAPEGSRLVYNSGRFEVSPNEPYTFAINLGNTTATGLPGYATIIWFDAQSHAMSREFLWAPRSTWRVTTLHTDGDGRFALPRRPTHDSRALPLVLYLSGADGYRGAYLELR